jgi:hypothetical protein
VANDDSNLRPAGLNLLNRRMWTRLYGGVGGGAGDCSPYPDFVDWGAALFLAPNSNHEGKE